jgi:hypothetical protein
MAYADEGDKVVEVLKNVPICLFFHLRQHKLRNMSNLFPDASHLSAIACYFTISF